MPKIEDMWLTPCTRPNGLQAADDGLWVISADDEARLQKLDYETGEAMLDVRTETYRSSGITCADEQVWVASTHNSRLYKLNQDGSTIEYCEPPGTGIHDPRDRGPSYNRPHGMEWLGDTMWVVIKPALAPVLARCCYARNPASHTDARSRAARHRVGRRDALVRRPRHAEDSPHRPGLRRNPRRNPGASAGAAWADDTRGRALVLLRPQRACLPHRTLNSAFLSPDGFTWAGKRIPSHLIREANQKTLPP